MLKARSGSKEQFADRVKTLRAKLAISASALAKSAEVSPASIWQWENAGAVPRKNTMVKLAQALGVSPDYLESGIPGDAMVPPAPAPVQTRPATLRDHSLEDLIKAIQAKGFHVTLSTRS